MITWRSAACASLLAAAVVLPAGASAQPEARVEFVWLSNTTWLIRADGIDVFADAALSRWKVEPPSFSRPESFALPPVHSDTALVGEVLEALDVNEPSWIVVGHGHPDHTIDLALFADLTDARIIGSRTACFQAEALGVSADRCRAVEGGEVIPLTPHLEVRVIRWAHSGNPDSRLGRLAQAPEELTAVPAVDPETGGLGPAPWQAYPNGGGARAYLFRYEVADTVLRWLVSDTGNGFTFDSVPGIGPDYLADVGVDMSHLDFSRAPGTPRQWLAEALDVAGVDTLDLWLGYGNVAHVRQVLSLVRARAFIPHHWGNYLAGFRPGITRPFERPALTALMDSTGTVLLPQSQYMERYELTPQGVRRLNSEEIRARLGLAAR